MLFFLLLCSGVRCMNILQTIYAFIRAAPKVIPTVLLSWFTTSKANVDDVTVDVEPFHQCSIIFCCQAACWFEDCGAIANLDCTVLPHPLCILDLAVFDFHPFGLMNNKLHGQHLLSNNTIIAGVEQWVNSACADFCENNMHALVHC